MRPIIKIHINKETKMMITRFIINKKFKIKKSKIKISI